MYIAKYYNKRSAHVAAIERVKYMLENYGGTPSTEEGMIVLVNSYNELGMTDLAYDSARVLKKNFPNYSISRDNNKINISKIVDENDIQVVTEESSWFDYLNIFEYFN